MDSGGERPEQGARAYREPVRHRWLLIAAAAGLTACAGSGGATHPSNPSPSRAGSVVVPTLPAAGQSPGPTPAATTPGLTFATPSPTPAPTGTDAVAGPLVRAGLQAWSDGYVAALDDLDVAQLNAVLDPSCAGGCTSGTISAIAQLTRAKQHAHYTQTTTPGTVTSRSAADVCLDATISSPAYPITDDATGKVAATGAPARGAVSFCLHRATTTAPWRVSSITSTGSAAPSTPAATPAPTR